MKLQLFIVVLFSQQVLTNQTEKKQPISWEEVLNSGNLDDFLNYPSEPDDSAPCSVNVPGFNSIGLMVVYFIVFAVSVMGNTVVIFVVCSMRNSRTSTDVYLMHLALADLIFCLTLPFWAAYTHYGWVFGNFLCKLLSGFQEVSIYSGIFLLVCISVDRYFAIVRATRGLSSHHLLVNVVCSIVWLVATVLTLPVAITREALHASDLNQTICYENLTGESSDQLRVSMRVLRHTVGFFLPLVVMAVCYGWTVVTLFHTRNQQKHKAMRVILAVVLAFVLCWLPHNVSVLIDTLIRGGSLNAACEDLYRVEVVLKVTQVLAFMHCAVNPVLYGFIGQKFRNQLLLALFKHGLISKKTRAAYKKGSMNSLGSIRSRNTSVTL